MQRRTAQRWVGVGLFVAMGVGAAGWGEEVGTRPGEEHGRDGHAATLPFTVSKETTGIVSPLHADGTPDYVAALNERYGKGVAAKDNAFVWWVGVMGTDILREYMRGETVKLCGAENAGLLEHADWKSYGIYLRDRDRGVAPFKWMDDEERALSKLWVKEDSPQLADYLESMGKFLDGTRDAFSHSRFWMPSVSKDGTMDGVVLPAISRMRELANCLSDRALLRAKGGDFAGFLSDAMAAKRMGLHLGAEPWAIEQLVGAGIDDAANRAIGVAVGSGIFSEEQCRQLGAAIEKTGTFPLPVDAVDVTERWSVLEDVILLTTGKGALLEGKSAIWHPEGMKIGWCNVECGKVTWDAVFKRVNAEFDKGVAVSKKKTFKEVRAAWAAIGDRHREFVEQRRNLQKDGVETEDDYTQRVGDAIIGEFVLAFGKAEELRRRPVMQDEMLKVLVAAAEYHAGKGKWPEKLSDLVPGYLKAVPENIYGEGEEKEVGYSFSDDGARIAVVIPDGKGRVVEVGPR